MVVKPFRRFSKRGYVMGLALPDTNHRDNEKNKGRDAEQRAAESAAGDCADGAEYRLHEQDGNVKSDTL